MPEILNRIRGAKQIGHGSEGYVYACQYKRKVVAIKRVNEITEADMELKNLCHPNVIRIFEFLHQRYVRILIF